MGHHVVKLKEGEANTSAGDKSTPTELSRSPGLLAQKSPSGEVK